MTQREEAMRRVVEAAREMADQLLLSEMTFEDRCDADVEGAYDTIDALPAEPEAVGETVEMAVWGNGLRFEWAPPHIELGKQWSRLGTVRLPLTKEPAP